ncbi:hypothetical protein ABT009_17800 [Streptomyces sp. NPDC002896]|uniref:hypothetical protein n=1 Tax=Streptomyces sp. NPDC002896 TaxID=3154438 RepID=UPI0033295C76
MSSSTLEALLPAGKKISSKESGSPGYTICKLVVDGQVALSGIIEEWESGKTIRNVAYGGYGPSFRNIKKEDSKYIISDSAAVGHAPCSKQQKDDQEVFTIIRKEHGSVGTAALEKAITEFTDAVSKSKQCTGSDG